MGTVSLLTPPDSPYVVTLAAFKTELGVTGSGSDALLQSLLDDAQSRVRELLGRPILRAQYRETMRGSGKTAQLVRVRPVMRLDAIAYQGDAQTLSSFEIDNRDAGILYRNDGKFTEDGDPNAWQADYVAGWFVSADDVVKSLSVGTANDYNDAASSFPTHLVPGDVFRASGFAEAANNGTKTVLTATTAKITVNETLVAEPPATPTPLQNTLKFENVPGGIKRAITILARESYLHRAVGSGVVGKTVGPVSTRWSERSGDAAESSVRSALSLYMDF